jgi:hypothetical protein
VRLGPVPRLNGAVTAQRAIPTDFGFRVNALLFIRPGFMSLAARHLSLI